MKITAERISKPEKGGGVRIRHQKKLKKYKKKVATVQNPRRCRGLLELGVGIAVRTCSGYYQAHLSIW
jgi:hypothetical protein